MMGFDIGDRVEPGVEKSTVRELAHKRLDEIMGWMEEGKAAGGEFLIASPADGVSYRITFCNFTGEKRCAWCNGTGAEGS